MPFKGETWIKTQTGWRTTRTIVIVNRKLSFLELQVASPYNSDSEDEPRSQNELVSGVYWQCGPPFVILPGETNRPSYLLSRSTSTEEEGDKSSPSVIKILTKLSFKQSIKNPRRFNYVTKMLEVTLKQDLLSPNGASQKKFFQLFQQLVNTVLSTEMNVHVASRLIKIYKEKHLAKKSSFTSPKLWSQILNQISDLDRKLHRFQVKKICCGSSNNSMLLLDLPVEALRLIFRCFSDHKDIASLASVNRYFYKLTNEAGLWKSLCLYHLAPSKLTDIDRNIPSQWRETYKNNIKRATMHQSYAEKLIICSNCHFVCWKGTHLCVVDPQTTNSKVPIAIPITPKGFLHLFEK